MQIGTLGYLALIIFSGMVCGRLVKLIKLPNVTGYLIAGLLIGPYCLKLVPSDAVGSFEIISTVALGFIAFSMGSEFKLSYLKKIGMMPIVIAIMEGLCAVIFVFVALVCFKQDPAFSIVLASIAAATAPAATIMVINQYKAKGPVTSTLLTVVAVDDAVALMAFGVCVAIASSITGTGNTNVLWLILSPVLQIIGALSIGALLGFLMLFPLKYFKKQGNRLCIIVGCVFTGIAIAELLGVSSLLLCMMMGSTYVNADRSEGDEVMQIASAVTPPIYLMFFVISGSQLNLTILPSIGLIGVIYIIFRVLGKMAGAAGGALLYKADKKIVKYLGPALLPQAGVAIGLALASASVVPAYAARIHAVILCGTLIYELIGPAVAKWSLKKAGEISE